MGLGENERQQRGRKREPAGWGLEREQGGENREVWCSKITAHLAGGAWGIGRAQRDVQGSKRE